MKIGVFLFDFFYRKYCGRPMLERFTQGGTLKKIAFLSIQELCRITPNILKHVQNIGVECIEIYNTPEKIQGMVHCLKDRGDLELILHEYDDEGYPNCAKLASRHSQIRRVAAENLKWLIDIAGELNAKTIVLHPPALNESKNEVVKRFKDCAQRASDRNVILSIENMGKREEQSLLDLIDAVGSDSLQCAFDSGHANIRFSPLDCAKKLGRKIAHVHWHDNDGSGDQHLPPGRGNINFGTLMQFLIEVDAQRENEITLTLECDKVGVNYEREWMRLMEFKAKHN